MPHKPAPSLALPENNTQRTVSKTKVSTGKPKTPISANFNTTRHSPLQGSPSYPHRKSPNQSGYPIPMWNANNVQSTLPSIPMIDMNIDDEPPTLMHHQSDSMPHVLPQQQSLPAIQPVQQIQQQPSHLSSSLASSNNMLIMPDRVHQPNPLDNEVGVLSSSSSSSDSDSSGSGSDSDSPPPSPVNKNNGHSLGNATHLLSEDLCLSDSASDSDSD